MRSGFHTTMAASPITGCLVGPQDFEIQVDIDPPVTLIAEPDGAFPVQVADYVPGRCGSCGSTAHRYRSLAGTAAWPKPPAWLCTARRDPSPNCDAGAPPRRRSCSISPGTTCPRAPQSAGCSADFLANQSRCSTRTPRHLRQLTCQLSNSRKIRRPATHRSRTRKPFLS